MSCLYYHKTNKKWIAKGYYKKKYTHLGMFEFKWQGQVALDVFHQTHKEEKKKPYNMHRLISDEVFDFNVGCICNYYHFLKRSDWNSYKSIYGKNDAYFWPEKEIEIEEEKFYKPVILG